MSTVEDIATAPPESAPDEKSADFRVYRPPQASANESSPGSSRELPESFFVPSAADLKAAQDSLSVRTHTLMNAPLRTQAMRDADTKVRMQKYPTTTIRVRFTDRTQLEKTFPSTDKIRSVYAFVRNSLREDVKPIKFVLYQTPPKRELKVSDPKVRDLSLFQLQLSPASVLHLKFEDDALNHVDVPAPLDLTILARVEDLPVPPPPQEPSQPEPSENKPKKSVSSNSSSKSKAVPRWLKLNSNK